MEISTGIEEAGGRSFNQLQGAINNARFDTGFPVDGNVDAKVLYTGSKNYYDALSNMGRPIEAFSQAVTNAKKADPNFKRTNAMMNLWTMAQDSANYVFALRRKDVDVYRLPFLSKYLNTPEGTSGVIEFLETNIDTAKKVGDWMKSSEAIPAIDFDATIRQYKNTVPDLENVLRKANQAFMAVKKNPGGELINKNHIDALKAALSAVTGCKCRRTIPREFKRKREFTAGTAHNEGLWNTGGAVHWGEPKAARSREMRAQRLASIGVSE